MGARSQVAGLIAAATVALILLFLTEPVQYLPKAVLGAVIVFAAIGLIEPQAWRALAAVDHVEVAIAALTAGCVVAFGVLEALVVAVGLSIVDAVRRSARAHDAVLGWVEPLGRYADVSLHPSATITPGIVVYRLDDRLFFANTRYFKGRIREAIRAAPSPTRWLVFDAEAMTHVDSTGLEAFAELVEAPSPRRDHARRRASAPAGAGPVRTGRTDRDDRASTLLPDRAHRRRPMPQRRGTRGMIGAKAGPHTGTRRRGGGRGNGERRRSLNPRARRGAAADRRGRTGATSCRWPRSSRAGGCELVPLV